MANQIINLNSITPATPAGKVTVYFQSDYGTPIANTSAYIDPLAATFAYTGALSGLPATATVGQLAFVTNAPAGQNIYVATAPNVWTQTGGTSAYVYTGVLSGLPATATVGQLAFITNAMPGQNVYVATATNTWTQSSSPAGGANTDVQFNDSGVLGGNAGFTYDKTTFAVNIQGATTIVNNTAATSIAVQNSPILELAGNAWNGAASQLSAWNIQSAPNSVSGDPILQISIAPGTYGSNAVAKFQNVDVWARSIRIGNSGGADTTALNQLFSGPTAGNAIQLPPGNPPSVTSIVTALQGNPVQLEYSNTLTVSAATPTGTASTVSLGTTTATSATAGGNGDVPAQVVGYLTIDIAGTKYQIPYYAV